MTDRVQKYVHGDTLHTHLQPLRALPQSPTSGHVFSRVSVPTTELLFSFPPHATVHNEANTVNLALHEALQLAISLADAYFLGYRLALRIVQGKQAQGTVRPSCHPLLFLSTHADNS